MPALGMAQDTGRLVAWRKAVGDRVEVGDILMEVETDKSTMEVEAAVAGYVTELRGELGADIPVGRTVAMISNTPDAVTSLAAELPPEAEAIVPTPTQLDGNTVAEPRPDGRLLASPKARRLAAEQGLDLSRLAAAGVPQPYRVADLNRLNLMPVKPAASYEGASQIAARADATGFSEFCTWLESEGTPIEPRNKIWSAFAAAALSAQSSVRPIRVRIVQPALGVQEDYSDPDQMRFSQLKPFACTPDLILYDLTNSRITGVQRGPEDCPVLTVVRSANAYELTLAYSESRQATPVAIALLDGFAVRLEEPLQHLL